MTLRSLLACAAILLLPGLSIAQSIGTFRWQAQPFCNVVTLVVTQIGAMYRLEGADDQCGASTQASVTGTAFPNPNGTIGIGLTIINSPGGSPVHLDATISPAAGYSGTWRDDGARTGAFVFTPGPGIAGPPRPGVTPTQAFVHTVTPANQAGDCTQVDHPLLDSQPNAKVLATHQWTGSYLGADFSVRLDGSRWYICRSSGSPPPLGDKFHVFVLK